MSYFEKYFNSPTLTVRQPPLDGIPITCYAEMKKHESVKYRLELPRISIFDEGNLFLNATSPIYETGYRSIDRFDLSKENNAQYSLYLSILFFVCKTIPREDAENYAILYYHNDTKESLHITYLVKTLEKLKIVFAWNNNLMSFGGLVETFRAKSKKILFISDYRSSEYDSKRPGSERYSIIDTDMMNQFRLAKEIQPEFSMMRYKIKLNDERELGEFRMIYRYPEGQFFLAPYPKRFTQLFLISSKNQLGRLKEYYHVDLESMVRHHDMNVRANMIYINRFDQLFNAYITFDDMEALLKDSPEYKRYHAYHYSCGLDWDHCAIHYILSLYLRYTGMTSYLKSMVVQMHKDILPVMEKVAEETKLGEQPGIKTVTLQGRPVARRVGVT